MLQIKEAKTTFFKSKEHYLEFIAAWKKAANQDVVERRPYPKHYIVYALLRGYPEDHGFTPISSEKKLNNGRHADEALNRARASIIWASKTHYKYNSPTIRSKVGKAISSVLGKITAEPKVQNIWMEGLTDMFGGTVSEDHIAIIGAMLETYTGPGLVQEFAPIFDVQVQDGV